MEHVGYHVSFKRFCLIGIRINLLALSQIFQSQLSRSKDLSITQVKKKIQTCIICIEDINSLKRFISIFGITAVVGLRKCLPSLSQRLQTNNNEIVTGRVAVQLLDVINVVDVESNMELGPQQPNYIASVTT
jgi:hypothetical protein